jgi:hypothetical protein
VIVQGQFGAGSSSEKLEFGAASLSSIVRSMTTVCAWKAAAWRYPHCDKPAALYRRDKIDRTPYILRVRRQEIC